MKAVDVLMLLSMLLWVMFSRFLLCSCVGVAAAVASAVAAPAVAAPAAAGDIVAAVAIFCVVDCI